MAKKLSRWAAVSVVISLGILGVSGTSDAAIGATIKDGASCSKLHSFSVNKKLKTSFWCISYLGKKTWKPGITAFEGIIYSDLAYVNSKPYRYEIYGGLKIPRERISGVFYDYVNKTLTLDGVGLKGHLPFSEVKSLVSGRYLSKILLSRIENTRAIDGQQTGTYSNVDKSTYNYAWSYHPDDGLNLIIEEVNNDRLFEPDQYIIQQLKSLNN